MNIPAKTDAMIFDVQGFSTHDGAGGRTVVFMKGCPLRCGWCSNPEGLSPHPGLMFLTSRCRPGCSRCVDSCGCSGVRQNGNIVEFDRTVCNDCTQHLCVQSCPTGALRVAGRRIGLDELMRILERDRDFWGPGGGVTFTGGEPLMQAGFLISALNLCRESYIDTAVETSASCDPGGLLEAARLTDWLFIDIKHMDPVGHRAGTGVDNTAIISNISSIARSGWSGRLIVRVPVIPGFNDTFENMDHTAVFMQEHGLLEINLLPFHRLGESKYAQLGIDHKYRNIPAVEESDLLKFAHVFESRGIACHIGSNTPF